MTDDRKRRPSIYPQLEPPADVCPSCQMSREHEPGCPYEHLSIAEAEIQHGDLTRHPGVTVNLTESTWQALQLASELTGTTEIAIINRAVQIYTLLKQVTAYGGSIYVQAAPDSKLELLEMF